MSDLNWCTYCDCAISMTSDALYCSDKCQRLDALDQQSLLEHSLSDPVAFLAKESQLVSTTIPSDHVESKRSFFYETDDHFYQSPTSMYGSIIYKTIKTTFSSINPLASQNSTTPSYSTHYKSL